MAELVQRVAMSKSVQRYVLNSLTPIRITRFTWYGAYIVSLDADGQKKDAERGQ